MAGPAQQRVPDLEPGLGLAVGGVEFEHLGDEPGVGGASLEPWAVRAVAASSRPRARELSRLSVRNWLAS